MSTKLIEIISLGVSFFATIATAYAAIKTAHAAKAAQRSADISAKQLSTQIKEQEKIGRPRIIPLNAIVLPHPTSVLSDWRTPKTGSGLIDNTEGIVDNTFIKLPGRFSNFKIPIINAGNSFAIDIVYSLTLVGGTDSIKPFDSQFAELRLPIPKKASDSKHIFTIQVIAHDFSDQQHDEENINAITLEDTYLVESKERHISIIESGKKSEIYIPSYFVVLFNIYHKEYYLNFEREDYVEDFIPKLEMKIEYSDQYNVRYTDTYHMELSKKQFHTTSYHPKYEAWIDFKRISSFIERES